MDPLGRPSTPRAEAPSSSMLSPSPRSVLHASGASRPQSRSSLRLTPIASAIDNSTPRTTAPFNAEVLPSPASMATPPALPPVLVGETSVPEIGPSPSRPIGLSPGRARYPPGHVGVLQALRSGLLLDADTPSQPSSAGASVGWSRPGVVVAPPAAPPPRDASRRRPTAHRNVVARRAADRGCAAASSGLGRSGVGATSMFGEAVAALGSASVFGRSPSVPAPRTGKVDEPSDGVTINGETPDSSSRNRAVSVDTAKGDDAARAKARAVAVLQKLFFEEMAKGKDASGAAAAALLRLSDQSAAASGSCTASRTNGSVEERTDEASSKKSHLAHGSEDDGDRGSDSDEAAPEAEAIEETVGARVARPRPPADLVPTRPSPVIGAPTRRRPSNLVRYRVAVQN